jgi:hypothetical protein
MWRSRYSTWPSLPPGNNTSGTTRVENQNRPDRIEAGSDFAHCFGKPLKRVHSGWIEQHHDGSAKGMASQI